MSAPNSITSEELIQDPKFSDLETFNEVLKRFEELELQIPYNTNDFTGFLTINDECLKKVYQLLSTEDTSGTNYFLSLIQIKDSLVEQRSLLENLSSLINPSTEPSQTIQNTKEPKALTLKSESIVQPKKQNNLLKSTPNGYSLDDIVGLTDVKQIMIESIIYPLKFPQLFKGARKAWNTILLYGPPGTGKTSIAHAIASEIEADFYNISSVDLLSKFIGESEKLIHECFTQIQVGEKRAIVLFDEIDALCKLRTSEEGDHCRRVKTQLLTEFQNAINEKNNSFIICTTNCPWDIDTAFLRRFQRKIFVPLPNREERKAMLQKHEEIASVCFSDDQWNVILNETDGFSGSDLIILANFVLYEPLKDLQNCGHWIVSSDGFFTPATANNRFAFESDIKRLQPEKIKLRNVEYGDFLQGLRNITKSVQPEYLKKYDLYRS